MTLKLSDRDLERLLRGSEAELRPPEGLLARLRAELPAELPAPVDPPSGPDGASNVLRPAVWWRGPLLTLAASLAVVAGGSFLAYRSFREAAPPGAATVAQPARDESVVAERRRQEAARLEPAAPAAPAGPPAAALKEEKAAGSFPVQPVEIPAEVPPLADQDADAIGIVSAEKDAAGQLGKKGLAAPKPAAAPQPAAGTEGRVVGGAPGGVPGGIYGGVPGGTPGGSATLTSSAEYGDSGGAPAPSEPGSGTASQDEPPLRLESPGIEANTLVVTEESPLSDLRELEAPAIQGDAVPASRAKGKDDAKAGEAWRTIERALMEGRWPTAEELAAARPRPAIDRLEATAGSVASRGAAAADPVEQLREQILDFFAKPDKTKKGLLELRRHAVRLAAKNARDEQAADLLRTLNLAARLL